MKINDLLGSLFSGGASAGSNTASAGAREASREQTAQAAQTANTDAVQLGNSFSGQGADAATRAKRIADLKAQVEQGTYSPPPRKVAESVYRELISV